MRLRRRPWPPQGRLGRRCGPRCCRRARPSDLLGRRTLSWSPACRVPSFLLTHHKTPPQVRVDLELRDGGGLSRFLIRGVDDAKKEIARPQQRGAPSAELVGGVLLLWGLHKLARLALHRRKK